MADQVQYYGTGRRKSSIARVFLRPGSGNFKINGREFDQYFVTEAQRVSAKSALVSSETATTFDVVATVNGGGVNGHRPLHPPGKTEEGNSSGHEAGE